MSRLPRRPRALFIAVLLVLALVLAGLLAMRAIGSETYQRAQAERVLRDYSAFAAWRVATRTGQELFYYAFLPVLKPFTYGDPNPATGPLPAPAQMGAKADSMTRALLRTATFTFRVDSAARRLETRGMAPSEREASWLVDTIVALSRVVHEKDWRAVAIFGQPERTGRRLYVAAIAPANAKSPRIGMGLDLDVRALDASFRWGAEEGPLLPQALTGGVLYDSMGSVIIRDAQGRDLYRSPVQYASDITARDTVGSLLGNLTVQIALRPEIAAKLVIGGLPRSRLPFLLGVLVLTVGLIVAALLQLRREYELSALRTDFVSGVSHELRTPLAQIRMFSETLRLGRVRSEEEERRSIVIIDQEARRLTHLVENLLHFSRAERRVAEVALEPTDLTALAREVIEAFAPLADAKQVTLAADLADGIAISADGGAVRQMLLNLLDNAVKYGPVGQTVTVALRAAAGAVRLSVQDQGPGVPVPDRERVWERFWRLSRDRGSSVAGTGIGLAVVRELTILHHGRTWVEEAPGGGARFVIELPAREVRTPP